MAENNDDLMHKADALMRRRRIFVAGANDPDGAQELAAAQPEEDVPLLTEVVGPELLADAAAVPHVDVAALRSALSAELDEWLDHQLPLHVQHVLDGITDQLILQLTDKARGELLSRLHAAILAQAGAKPDSAGE